MDWPDTTSLRRMALHVVGAFLLLAGVGLEAMTARGLLNYHASTERHGGEVIDLNADTGPQAGQRGFMARIVGTPQVVEAARDAAFNLQVNTPLLMRHAEMFQWREIRIGGSVHYELDWVDHLVDASHFQQPGGHLNPAKFPIRNRDFLAGLVTLGGFKLSAQLLHALPGYQPVSPDLQALPANMAASFGKYGNYLVTSSHAGAPQLGDVRVSWGEIPLQQVTVFARIDGDRLVAATDASDGKGYHVEIGNVSLLDMFPDIPMPPEFVQGKRILALLLAALGALLLCCMKQQKRADIPLAMGLSGLAVGSVASVVWLGHDTGILLGWLAVAMSGLLLAIWRVRLRAD
ncbi:MAG: hypothetical protein EPN74_03545 [Rhodanobacter sp.]|nr:MAG: hypothetical protein EPN74_03545 [Rhodanobacter sp.]